MLKKCFVFILLQCAIVLVSPGLSREYHWPLEAEPAMTSTFCEYRPGHFHSGIDLKTWGRTGLNVFALDDGYVWRVKVSPWGSGRALYLKLIDGRCAVYFHLSDYAPFIRSLVEAEQERRGGYSIDRFFDPWQVPVKRGQVVALSGESGTGAPHLHVEIRDSLNRPLNPLGNGFHVDDFVPPTITALSVTPLGMGSTVNGRHDAVVLPVRLQKAGTYLVDEPVTTTGPVGIGIRHFDRADAAWNKLAVYGTDLFVDDRLEFRSRYDRFPFQQTGQVALDRDFSLIQSGRGQFQRLYSVVGNELPFYAASSGRGPDGYRDAGDSSTPDWTAVPGWHTVRIVARDAGGNAATVGMDVLVDEPPRIEKLMVERDGKRIFARAVVTDPDDEIVQVEFSYSLDSGENWILIAVDSSNTPTGVYEADMDYGGTETVLYRVRALDGRGLWSIPGFYQHSVTWNEGGGPPTSYACHPAYHETFVEWTITADHPILVPPEIMVRQPGGDLVQLYPLRCDLYSFSVVYPFHPHADGRGVLSIRSENRWQNDVWLQFPFDVYTVTREGGGVRSFSGNAEARFASGGAYGTFMARIEDDSTDVPPFLPPRSGMYRFHPAGVPFNRGATITVAFDSEEGRVDRTGLYRHREGDSWSYVGADIDSVRGTVSSTVGSFGLFALLEDTLDPEIWNLKPGDGAHVGSAPVECFARISDQGSGLGRETDLVMELDGRKVISEYDPEGHWLKHVTKGPLIPGTHTLRVEVTDMAGNTVSRESRFTVR